jgi:hypothetical protein
MFRHHEYPEAGEVSPARRGVVFQSGSSSEVDPPSLQEHAYSRGRLSSLGAHQLSSRVSLALSQAISTAAGSMAGGSSGDANESSLADAASDGESSAAESLEQLPPAAVRLRAARTASPAPQMAPARIRSTPRALAALQSMASTIPSSIMSAFSALTSPKAAGRSRSVPAPTSDTVSPAASSCTCADSDADAEAAPPEDTLGMPVSTGQMSVTINPWREGAQRSGSGTLSQLGSVVRSTDEDTGAPAGLRGAQIEPAGTSSGSFFGEVSIKIAAVQDRAAAARDAAWFGANAAPPLVRFASGLKGSQSGAQRSSMCRHSRARRRWGRIASERKGMLASVTPAASSEAGVTDGVPAAVSPRRRSRCDCFA